MSTQLINQVLELTNVERAKAGLKPLTLNNQLAQAAQGHSDSMATDDFFSHTGADGSNVGDRLRDSGYKYSRAGENIAVGQQTAEKVVSDWMNSPGHRANILNPNFTEIGIGYEFLENDTGSVNYNHYWTQVFGTSSGNSNSRSNEGSASVSESNSKPVQEPKLVSEVFKVPNDEATSSKTYENKFGELESILPRTEDYLTGQKGNLNEDYLHDLSDDLMTVGEQDSITFSNTGSYSFADFRDSLKNQCLGNSDFDLSNYGSIMTEHLSDFDLNSQQQQIVETTKSLF